MRIGSPTGTRRAASREVSGVLAALLPLVVPVPALAPSRVALVAENSNYAHIGRLPNPGNDATDMGWRWSALRFDVTLVQFPERRP